MIRFFKSFPSSNRIRRKLLVLFAFIVLNMAIASLYICYNTRALMHSMMNSLLQENAAKYLLAEERWSDIQILNIVIIIVVVILNIILILRFTDKITKPIITLSRTADEISRGNLEVKQVIVDTNDEISVMADAINRMTTNIRQYIGQIREKAELEGRLKEQEMQNRNMKANLREVQYAVLQSQINPHFIFNTLNAGVQIAMMEGADLTCEFIENVSNLLRYNLKKLGKPITLEEEIKNIKAYVHILKSRFADQIDFSQNIDESILDVRMPCMILQPLVENAFIHGIGDKETGGRISLTARKVGDIAEIVIGDNGKGMDKEKIDKLLRDNPETGLLEKDHPNSGHTTGLGINNVISRLKLFFCMEDVLNIASSPGAGTRVIIRIPVKG